MKKLIYLLLCTFIFMNCNRSKITISGKIEGVDKQEVLKLIKVNYETKIPDVIDSAIVSKEVKTFSFGDVKLENPDFLFLVIENLHENKILFISPGDNVTLDIDLSKGLQNVLCEGSKTNEQYEEVMKKFIDIQTQARVDYQELDKAREQGDKSREQEILGVIDSHRKELVKLPYSFFKENKDSYLVPWLYVTCTGLNDEYVDLEELEEINLGMNEGVKNTYFGQVLLKYRNVNQGGIAPDFKLKDNSDNEVSLSQFKGKTVLLSFWAHWEEGYKDINNNLSEIQSLYSDNDNFKILSVFLGTPQDIVTWKEILSEAKYSFLNLIGDEQIIQSYFLNNPFSNFIIDGEGKIIDKNIFGDELKSKLSEIIK